MRWSIAAIVGLLVGCLEQRPPAPPVYAASAPELGSPRVFAQRGDSVRAAPAVPERHAQPEPPEDSEPVSALEPAAPEPLLPPPADADPEQPPDAVLEREVAARLIRDPLTAGRDIEVDVSAGIATLTGRVTSLAIAQAAEDLAAAVPGVGFVYNSISLYPAPVAQVPPRANTDAALAERIRARLGIDPHDPAPGALRVDVADGIATITGTARTSLEQTLIVSEAYAEGATRVVNRMSLVPLVIDPSGRSL